MHTSWVGWFYGMSDLGELLKAMVFLASNLYHFSSLLFFNNHLYTIIASNNGYKVMISRELLFNDNNLINPNLK